MTPSLNGGTGESGTGNQTISHKGDDSQSS